jgi:hypothetical protein
MACAVCGKEFGLWAKMSGQSGSGICKTCHEQGHNRLDTLARLAGGVQNLDQQHARGWLSQFEDHPKVSHPSRRSLTVSICPAEQCF